MAISPGVTRTHLDRSPDCAVIDVVYGRVWDIGRKGRMSPTFHAEPDWYRAECNKTMRRGFVLVLLLDS